jgi:hypothetical protein
MDQMYTDPDKAKKAIIASLELIQKAHRVRPATIFQQMYLNTKSEEIMKIFLNASAEDKAKVLPILLEIDPNNTNQYNRINKS